MTIQEFEQLAEQVRASVAPAVAAIEAASVVVRRAADLDAAMHRSREEYDARLREWAQWDAAMRAYKSRKGA